jgi:ribosomal protein S21
LAILRAMCILAGHDGMWLRLRAVMLKLGGMWVSWHAVLLIVSLFLEQVNSMVNVTIDCEKDESADSMWRRFRKATDRADVFKDAARSHFFVSRSERRAAKSSRARARKVKYENASA